MKIKKNIFILLAFIAAAFGISCKSNGTASAADEKVTGEEIAELSYAPMVPKPITRIILRMLL